jgi:hypothetical protein
MKNLLNPMPANLTLTPGAAADAAKTTPTDAEIAAILVTDAKHMQSGVGGRSSD